MIIKKLKYNTNIYSTLTAQNDDTVIQMNLNPVLKSLSETKEMKIINFYHV